MTGGLLLFLLVAILAAYWNTRASKRSAAAPRSSDPPLPLPPRPSRTKGGQVAPVDPATGADALGLTRQDRADLGPRPANDLFWFRRDLVPPAGDPRSSIVERAMVRRGLITEEELAAIHAVGDAWLRERDLVPRAVLEAAAGEVAVQALRAERAAAREAKRAEAAARREARKKEVAERRARDIVFAGRGVSSGLADRTSDPERLQRAGLPVLSTPAELALAMGLDVPKLRWLCFHAEATKTPHYVYFDVPKRSGGTRRLASPHEELAAAQGWVLREILERLQVSTRAHGFVKGRSTVTNAREHVRSGVVVNLDLEAFFPTIVFTRVRGLFHGLGYSPAVATLLALLTTEAPRTRVEHEGEVFWVALGDRALPQGACTSPALSNQIARRLDLRLAGLARRLSFSYTRYADDLTFSTKNPRAHVPELVRFVRDIVVAEGFRLHEKKGRVQRRGARQSVTGVVVNDRPAVPREEVRRLRAILHQARKEGLDKANRKRDPGFLSRLQGKIAYVSMIDAEKGARLRAELSAVLGAAPRS